MEIINAVSSVLNQLKGVLIKISDDDYTRPIPLLSESTVGQHVRHTLEFFICLEEGCKSGIINYDDRKRNKMIESDLSVSIAVIDRLLHDLTQVQARKDLLLEGTYESDSTKTFKVATNAERELVYNIEHAIHHMALLKIGIKYLRPGLEIPRSFGVASSTIRYEENTLKR
jgi:hypothetical protein